MWIKKPKNTFSDSFVEDVNFLFKKDNIFIMDNHLAAGWCWMKYLDTSSSYNLFHIDRHDDLLDDYNSIKSRIIDKKIDVSKLHFKEYCSLLDYPNGSLKLFTWDNYIINTKILYPDFFKIKYFATHEKCSENSDFVDIQVSFDELIPNLPYWIGRNNENKWIINIDIDYFFGEIDSETIQVFSDQYIVKFAKAVKKSIINTAIITICLSPECSIDWDNSLRITNMICKELGINFPLDSKHWK